MYNSRYRIVFKCNPLHQKVTDSDVNLAVIIDSGFKIYKNFIATNKGFEKSTLTPTICLRYKPYTFILLLWVRFKHVLKKYQKNPCFKRRTAK